MSSGVARSRAAVILVGPHVGCGRLAAAYVTTKGRRACPMPEAAIGSVCVAGGGFIKGSGGVYFRGKGLPPPVCLAISASGPPKSPTISLLPSWRRPGISPRRSGVAAPRGSRKLKTRESYVVVEIGSARHLEDASWRGKRPGRQRAPSGCACHAARCAFLREVGRGAPSKRGRAGVCLEARLSIPEIRNQRFGARRRNRAPILGPERFRPAIQQKTGSCGPLRSVASRKPHRSVRYDLAMCGNGTETRFGQGRLQFPIKAGHICVLAATAADTVHLRGRESRRTLAPLMVAFAL